MSAILKIRARLAALLAAGCTAFAAHAGEIALQPASLEVEVAPGAAARQVVTLVNMDRVRPVSVSLSLAGWTQDAAGSIVFPPAGETETPAAGWVRFGPPTVSLAPGQSKQIALDLAAPQALARAGDYRVALIASTVLRDDAGAWQERRIASLLSLTAGAAASHPAITGSRLTVTDTGTPAIALDIANTGNAHARLEGTVEIRGDGGNVRFLPVGSLVVLDGASRTLTLPLDAPLPPNPAIDVRLENLFAPQKANETEALPVYRVQTETTLASLAPVAGGLD